MTSWAWTALTSMFLATCNMLVFQTPIRWPSKLCLQYSGTCLAHSPKCHIQPTNSKSLHAHHQFWPQQLHFSVPTFCISYCTNCCDQHITEATWWRKNWFGRWLQSIVMKKEMQSSCQWECEKEAPDILAMWGRSSWCSHKSGSRILNQRKQDYNLQDLPPRACFYHPHLMSLRF